MDTPGIQPGSVSNRTIHRVLRKHGVFYIQVQKKGLVTEKDFVLRMKFAKYVQRENPKDVWQNKIAFYLDGVFVPQNQSGRPSKGVFGTKNAKVLIEVAQGRVLK